MEQIQNNRVITDLYRENAQFPGIALDGSDVYLCWQRFVDRHDSLMASCRRGDEVVWEREISDGGEVLHPVILAHGGAIWYAWSEYARENWRILAMLWALLPLVNALVFTQVPLVPLTPEGESGLPLGALFRTPRFWLFLLLMACAGASELSISQWASAFAESALGVSKTVGDLAGPLSFALLMGLSRLVYAAYSRTHPSPVGFMTASTALCIAGYLLVSLSPWPALALAGCALCGQCITHCPTGALTARDDTVKVLDALADPEITTVVQIAPAVRVAWAESFGLTGKKAATGKMVAALRASTMSLTPTSLRT